MGRGGSSQAIIKSMQLRMNEVQLWCMKSSLGPRTGEGESLGCQLRTLLRETPPSSLTTQHVHIMAPQLIRNTVLMQQS